MAELTPLHTHTVYSILDGMIKIPNYVAWAKGNNMKALAITDHASMAGAIKFYKECNKNDIIPILGCEFYMTLGEVEEGQKDNFHLVLLAKNKTGWLNLIKLHNASYYNYKRKPRITFDDLKKYGEGLICLSACLGGLIPQDILNSDMHSLVEHLKKFKAIFGDDFYLEIQDHDTLEEKKVWGKLLELSHKTGIKAIATNDSHYEKREHAFAHEVLLCKQTVKKISDEKRFKFSGGPEYYLKNTEEMRKTFSCLSEEDWNRILDTSEEIISKIERYDILQHGYNYPRFDEPQKSFKKLVELSRAGFERRFKGKPIDTKQYVERLKYELETIYKIGFTDYFLVLEDLYRHMRKELVPTGFGRGCLIYNTPVVTDSGIKQLGEIKAGDKVVTHDGTWKTVEQTHEYDCDEKLLTIDTWCSSPYLPTMTSDHKVLVVKQPFSPFITKYEKDNYIKNATKINAPDYLNKGNLKWIRADEVEQGDYLVRPIYKNRYSDKFIDKIDLAKFTKYNDIVGEDYIDEYCGGNQNSPARTQRLPRYLNIDEDFLYLLGFYIGDGWTHKGAVVFACHEEKDLKVIEFIHKYFKSIKICDYKENGKKAYQVYVYSRIFAKLFEEIVPKYASNKLIPDFALSQNLKKLQILFEGLIQSDGSYSEDRICYDTVNINLINQLRYLGDLLGYTSNITVRKSDVDSRGYKRSESYKIRFNKQTLQLNSFNDGEYVYMKVKSVEEYENKSKKVYDITVNDNHDYQTLDCIVHNSGAGSLVLYTLDVTNLDPIEHDLLFERFINPSRVSAPDVDCDIADVDRPKVIAYLEERYGKDHVANIATYGEMTSVSSFKAVASVLEMPYLEANHITKDMIDTNLSLQENLEQNDELKKMYDTDPLFHKIFDVSQILEGGIDKAGQHACGLIISNQPLENLTPLTYQQDSSGRWVNCAVFDMKEIDGDLQLLKLDILGLKNLSIINETIEKMGIDFDYKNMPFTDEKTFDMISEAKTLGVFQLESEIARKLCRDIKPKTLADLGAINALLRPASLESGVTQQFIDRKNGVEPVKYICEGMEDYTKNTYGLCIFQEQLMQLSRVMAGYTLAEADTLRKCIGKKLLEKLKAEREHFVSGAIKNGHTETYANEVFDMIEKAGRYGFNASHAYAYSAMSYVTAFLKVNYPLEYMTAMLNNNRDKMEKLTPYIDECYRIGINVLSPDLNKSDNIFSFDKENNGILFGFTAIKGIGQSAIEPILLERENGDFKSLKDLIIRCPSTNKTTLENLIMSGALNNIEACPYKYMKPLQVLCKARAKSSYKKGETDLYTAMIECYVSDIVKKHPFYMDLDKEYKSVEGSTKEAKQQKAEIKKKMNSFIQLAVKKFEDKTVETSVTDQEVRQNEIEMVGFPISNNPKKILIELENLIDSTPIATMLDNHNYSDMFSFMGRFKSVKKTKNGSYFAVITDDTTEITTFMKADTYFEIQDKINTSNYFRFIGQINKSTNEKFADNFKIEGVRLFNVGKSSEIKLISHLDNESLNNFLTNIRNNAIINMSDINYRLIIYHNDKKLTTKVDYWISNLQEIASEMIKYNITTVKE